MTKNLPDVYEDQYQLASEPYHYTYAQSGLPNTDYRDVLVIRNIYKSLVCKFRMLSRLASFPVWGSSLIMSIHRFFFNSLLIPT